MNQTTSNPVYTGVLDEGDQDIDRDVLSKNYSKEEVERTKKLPIQFVWPNVIVAVVLHLIAFSELYKLLVVQRNLIDFGIIFTVGTFFHLGVNVGAHRYWAHRSFKAKWPLKMLLLVNFTISGQNSVYEWVRDHRVHHKFCETDADPHNIKRGFFFAHMGWLLCKKHPDVKEKGKTVDLSDLESDPLIMWHHKLYPFIAPIFIFLVPMWVYSFAFPHYSMWELFASCAVARYVVSLHLTWLINSYSHVFGTKPYEKAILATDSILYSALSLGEAWHNYHHVFPWDYRSSEWTTYGGNLGAGFIDLMAWLGLAYDLKSVDPAMIKKRAIRTGDGSHPSWGWGDKDTTEQQIKATVTLHKQK